jgi:hypothetical protein
LLNPTPEVEISPMPAPQGNKFWPENLYPSASDEHNP